MHYCGKYYYNHLINQYLSQRTEVKCPDAGKWWCTISDVCVI